MKKQWKFVLAGILLIVLVLLYPRISTLTDVDALRASLAPFGWLAALVFFFIYIIAGIMFLPLSVFSIAARHQGTRCLYDGRSCSFELVRETCRKASRAKR